jgi:glycosyltransferase involved in cell wall biosynthesis
MTLQPQISVCIFSYNFGQYLEQAIESVLAQKLSVPFEIIIGDDKSTDNSAEIIYRYQQLYPGIIRANINTENIGGTRNWLNTMKACRGKYISLLDGDDYFIDPLKLQKQYDVLEAHPEYSLSFHGVEEVYEDIPGERKLTLFKKEVFTLSDIIRKGWFMRTSSMFFRNHLLPNTLPEWVYDFPYRLDSIIPVMLCMQGDASYANDVMSVWRKHSMGMSYQLHEDGIRNLRTKLELSQRLDELTGDQYKKESKTRAARLYTALFLEILRSNYKLQYSGVMLKAIVRMDYRYLFYLLKGQNPWR